MTPDTAIALIDGLVYKPGWSFETTDHCHRYENSVLVRINYPAQRSERAEAADGYATTITTYAKFIILLDKLDDVGLYRRLLDHIACIDSHEAREFLRTRPTLWAPFHPHKTDGMERWGDVAADLVFGVA
jgi:hypothetical protein